jgi:hypothetical protein
MRVNTACNAPVGGFVRVRGEGELDDPLSSSSGTTSNECEADIGETDGIVSVAFDARKGDVEALKRAARIRERV